MGEHGCMILWAKQKTMFVLDTNQLEIMSWNVLTRTMMGGMEGSFRLETTPKNTVRISTMDKAKNIKYIGNETIKSTLSGKGQLTSRHSWFNFSMYYFILKLLSRNTKLKRMQNRKKILCLGITPTILIGVSFECGMKISFWKYLILNYWLALILSLTIEIKE